MNVKPAWDANYTGKGILVAVVDDGVKIDHPDLSPNMVSYDDDDDDNNNNNNNNININNNNYNNKDDDDDNDNCLWSNKLNGNKCDNYFSYCYLKIILNLHTVKPVLSRPLLSGHLPKSQR